MRTKLLLLSLLGLLALPLSGWDSAQQSAGYDGDRSPLSLMTVSEGKAEAEVTSPFGMNVHLATRFQGKDDPSNALDITTELLTQGGVAWTREGFCWGCIEPWPHQTEPRIYRWQVSDYFDYDSSIPMASEQGINILGLIADGPRTNVNNSQLYTHGECNMDDSAAPIDDWLPAWREFVRTVVTRYRVHIHYWEIQNEPNWVCFWRKADIGASSPNAVDYVKVLRAAYEEIHQVDPHAQVVLGGLSPEFDREGGVDYFHYLAQIYDAGGWPYFDILAIHPYRAPHFPEEVLPRSRFNVETLQYQAEPNQYNFTDEVIAFEGLMSHWGEKPIWITEIGWATEALKVRAAQRGTQPEIVQSDYLIRVYVQAIAAGVQKAMWYDFRDDVVPDSPTESSFGIIQRDFSPKPAYYGFSTMASLLAGSKFQEQVRGQEDRNRPGNDDVYEYRFAKDTQTIIVLWKSQGGDEPRTVKVDNIDAPTVEVFGPDFGPTTLDEGTIINTSDSTISLELTERPLFVVFDTSASSVKLDALLVGQSSFLILKPGEHSSIHFDVQNTGSVAWTVGQEFLLENVDGETLGASSAYALENEVPPGQVTRWEIPIIPPEEIGSYNTKWQMTYNGEPFGPLMACLILVMPEGDIDIDPLALFREWLDNLVEYILAELNTFWENLKQQLEEWLQRELERLWREFWENLFRQCCGTSAIVPAALLLAAWGIHRRQRGRTKHDDRD